MTAIGVIVALIVGAVGVAAGYFIGYNNRKKTAEAQIGSAEAEATRLVNEAIKTADQKRKEAVLEAKDEAFRLKAEVDAQKAEADKEIKQRRAEISRQENRIDQKETALDRKTEALEKKEEELKKRAAEAEERLAEIDALRAKEMERLETLAGLSQEDAREVLLHKVDEELTHEKAVRVAAYETDLKENCDNIARNLIGQAVSRCAADHCSETTVSVVPLPSDEMKGRIIGREGRNIRALETATGVDLIIDDTPEAITLSSFDQTRREVARMTLERLIGDGRIHPARIEETVEKCRHDLELQMKREGERAVMELGIHGLHPDLIKLIGRLKYRTSFGQNALTHSMEVAWVAGLLAGEMGVNVTMARRAGLLHDIGKALDHEIEGSHVQIGVDICRKYKENTQIIHAIEAHHGDVSPRPRWPSSFRLPMPSAPPARVPAARTWKATSSVWKIWRRSLPASRVWSRPLPCRQAARCAFWSSPTSSAMIRSSCWHAPLPKKSRIRWITPARSRSTSSARAAPWSTQNKVFSAGCRVFARQPVFLRQNDCISRQKKVSWMQKKAKSCVRRTGRKPATTSEQKGASFYEKMEEITGLSAGQSDGTGRIYRL